MHFNLILLFYLTFSNVNGFSQELKQSALSDSLMKADTEAIFPGGEEAMYQYIETNINYPRSSIKMNEYGEVLVQFVIEKDGSVSHVEIVRGVSFDLDKESIRVIGSMPNWTPARLNGEIVRARYTLPIKFILTPKVSRKERRKNEKL